MQIGVNGFFWNQPDTGSGQYVRQLVYHLNRYVSDLEISLIYPQATRGAELGDVPPSVRLHPVETHPSHVGKVWFEQVAFPRLCREIGVEVAHVPYWGAPFQSPVPLVVTIHDLIPLRFAVYQTGIGSRLYNSLVSVSARGATAVVTDSNASKNDIIQLLDIPPHRITPIYLGVGTDYTPDENLLLDLAIQKKYALPDQFLLYLGGYPVHKNVLTLFHAYTYVRKGLGKQYPLLLAGRPPRKVSPQFPDYQAKLAELGLEGEDKVRWLGFIDEADKPAVYRAASSFVFPSSYEGFGLPPLEAMACGTPVVTTTAPGIAEVVGEAAMAVEPYDPRQMGGGMIATLIQQNLAQELREKGLARAAQFSWQKTAAETVRVYAEVVG